MCLYKKTGCFVLIVGYLRAIPKVYMDKNGDYTATFDIMRKKVIQDELDQCSNDDVIAYRVFATGNAPLRIRQFGFPGLYLWIEGDLKSTGEIIADKIGFLDFPEPSSSKTALHSLLMDDYDYEKKIYLTVIDNNRSAIMPNLLH